MRESSYNPEVRAVQDVKESISDKRRLLEIAAASITALGKFLFMDYLDWKLFFVLAVLLGWSTYIYFRWKKVNGILRYWGFRTDNLKRVGAKVVPFGVLCIAASIFAGYLLGTINITWHIVPILLMYPLWGIIQQFLLIGLVAGNLQDMTKIRFSEFVIVLSSAILFSAIHYPSYWLILGTFILAFFYVYTYLRSRNVYLLGLLHGWIGAIFFYSVVGRDPFQEAFGMFLP